MSKPTVHIRSACYDDLPDLITLVEDFSKANPSTSPTAINDRGKVKVSLERVLNEEHCQTVVAESFGEIVAVMVLATIPSLVHAGRVTLFIDLLVVKEAHRRKGIGTSMVKYATKRANDVDAYKILLVTRIDNLPAQRLYRKCSFAINGKGWAFYVTPHSKGNGVHPYS